MNKTPVKYNRKKSNMKKSILTNWKTTAGGIASLLGGVVILLEMLNGKQDFNTDRLAVALGMIGMGVSGLMARDADKSSEDNMVRVLVMCMVPLFLIGGVKAGEEESIIPAVSIEEIDEEGWLDHGSIWTFAWYDVSQEESGMGLRLAYDFTEELRFRWDYVVEDFGFEGSQFSDDAELTLSMRYDLFQIPNIKPYLIAGGGTASLSSFKWQYLIGAGVDYEFNNGITLFSEFLHIRTEENNFLDRNEFRIGAGIPLSSLSGVSSLWTRKEESK